MNGVEVSESKEEVVPEAADVHFEWQSTDDARARYRRVDEAIGSGTYIDLLDTMGAQVSRNAVAEIESYLREIALLPSPVREAQIERTLRYWSTSRKKFEDTSLELPRAVHIPYAEILAGQFDPKKLARRLVEACLDYDEHVTIPLLEQLWTQSAQVRADGSTLLFLARDFTCAWVFFRARGMTEERALLASVSRIVRDRCLADESGVEIQRLKTALERAGLSSERARSAPLRIYDSSMKGKIPAVILRALCADVNDREAWEILSRGEIRYIRSARKKGRTLAEIIRTSEREEIDRETWNSILSARFERIEEFTPLEYPTRVASHVPRRHKLFEWRPKATTVADRVEDGMLSSEGPRSPAEAIACTIGLMLDYSMLVRAGRGGELVAVARRIASSSPPTWSEIDRVAGGGVEALRRWQKAGEPTLDRLAIVETKDERLPYELRRASVPVMRLVRVLGEGKNVVAYETAGGTALKVVKRSSHARKNLLLAWAEKHLVEVGIEAARVLGVEGDGLYVEQELVPGLSLEELYGQLELNEIPDDVKNQALDHFARAKELIRGRGIYLDLKSANYHARADGTIVMVDFVPRVNQTYARYFRNDDGSDRSPEQFLDAFFHHEIRKQCK